MIGRLSRFVPRCLFVVLCFAAFGARAEPYSRRATGPQMRAMPRQPHRRRFTNDVRRHIFADRIAGAAPGFPARPTGRRQLGQYLRAGGDLRFDASLTQAPHTRSVDQFALSRRGSMRKRISFPIGCSLMSTSKMAPGGALNPGSVSRVLVCQPRLVSQGRPDVPALRAAASGPDCLHSGRHRNQH